MGKHPKHKPAITTLHLFKAILLTIIHSNLHGQKQHYAGCSSHREVISQQQMDVAELY